MSLLNITKTEIQCKSQFFDLSIFYVQRLIIVVTERRFFK
ncbi:MAG: hypothetical protein RL662_225 [Bacteroidota bacterium]|jgi:hypothetical protein